MRPAVRLVDGMAESMLNFTEVGDPATVLELDTVTMRVKKETVEDVNSETIVTNQGSLDLPEIPSLIDVETGTCIEQTVFFASFNPQMWVESSVEVNSHTLRFNLESCDPENITEISAGGTGRRRRRSIGDQAGSYKCSFCIRLFTICSIFKSHEGHGPTFCLLFYRHDPNSCIHLYTRT